MIFTVLCVKVYKSLHFASKEPDVCQFFEVAFNNCSPGFVKFFFGHQLLIYSFSALIGELFVKKILTVKVKTITSKLLVLKVVLDTVK